MFTLKETDGTRMTQKKLLRMETFFFSLFYINIKETTKPCYFLPEPKIMITIRSDPPLTPPPCTWTIKTRDVDSLLFSNYKATSCSPVRIDVSPELSTKWSPDVFVFSNLMS